MKKRISDICQVINGRAYKQNELLQQGKYRVLRVGNFFTSDKWYYSDFELAEDKYCDKGDLLFAWSATFGPKIWDGEKVIYHYHIWKMIPDVSVIDKWYLYYWLKKNVSNITAGVHGSVMAHITKSEMENFEIDIPPLRIQQVVASILRTIDDKIRNNKAINDNLEQQASSVFHHFFISNSDPAWKEGTVADLGTVVGGSTPSKSKPEYYTDHGIAWITPKDLSVDKSKFIQHGADDITDLGLRNSSASIMPKGTVLFSSRAPIGYIAIADGDVTTNQGFKSVVPHVNIGTPYVYYSLKSSLPIIENMATGSTFREISGSTMKSVPAIIPDNDTLQYFTEFCDPLFQKQRALELENRKLLCLRDLLLPKLMSGELDVSDIDL